ncbi:isomerase [Halothiobacillus diazotrophicus]|uniref:Isomerase n=1 Tax=Halothiobacillus diazotrophicus TaxID=1860122 RepID=A0A191ZJG5_9GAMM|nr:PhzF family phenazine biosynthesis protein [Halothiobacillus diazotrophicus]ANJ68046.1 isomerase [Halothiobacillus diazotrophicus]
MMLKLYQVDAFTSRPFGGNPAAVVPLDNWLPEDMLQAIANENNLSETAFFVPSASGFELRWFTPVREVDLCGHATLATAYVLFDMLGYDQPVIRFETRSGPLFVEKQGDRLVMDFPADPPEPCPLIETLILGLGQPPRALLVASDYLAVYDDEATIRAIKPDQNLLAQLDRRGVMVTAPGDTVDFVSRFFAPKYGILEDPVTGSAHCTLAPYWAERLGKTDLEARQISPRVGEISCHVRGDRVTLVGSAVLYLEGSIRV